MTLERRYEQAREIFREFMAGLEANNALLNEVLAALDLLLTERSTSFYENRFVSGGVAEAHPRGGDAVRWTVRRPDGGIRGNPCGR